MKRKTKDLIADFKATWETMLAQEAALAERQQELKQELREVERSLESMASAKKAEIRHGLEKLVAETQARPAH